MKLELRKARDGASFVICVVSEKTGKQIVIPVSFSLSGAIDRMVRAEGIEAEKVILPPGYLASKQ